MATLEFLSEAESKQRDEIIQDLNKAYNQRSLAFPEFDEMTYDSWYVANKKASTGFMRPKKNKEDLRIVTGTTREKCNTIVTALLRYTFDFEIAAYDEQDWPNRDLGMGLEALVRKSRKLEDPMYEEKRALWYNEFVAQGNLFLYEMSVEEEVIRKTMENNNFDDVFKAEWKEKKSIEHRCETDMIPGLNVYLGNIREKFMSKQPFVGIRRELHKSEAEAKYGTFKRWKEAEMARNKVLLDQGGQEYNNWQMMPCQSDYKEEIRYFNVHTNTYQIMLDGVPMLPEGFPLEFALGVRKYPIIKVDAEPISAVFAYCRGIATKNKFNQAFLDEMFKMIALKFRKSTNPPMANLTGKMLNKSIFEPGTVHQGIDPEKLKPIGDNSAMTGPEFDTFQLVKQAIDESSVSPILEGNRTPGEQTAQEISTLKAQSLLKLGMIMVGCIQMEEQLIWLRSYNILKNWTAPIDSELEEIKGEIKRVNKYRSESVEMPLENGQMGAHIVNMVEGDQIPASDEQVEAEEDTLTRKKGVPVRITYLNAEEISSLKYKLYVKVRPVEKDHTELEAVLFEESLLKAKQIFPEQVNDAYAKEHWANQKKLDPRKFWKPAPPQGMPQPAMEGDKTVGAQAMPQATQQMKPSLKRMM